MQYISDVLPSLTEGVGVMRCPEGVSPVVLRRSITTLAVHFQCIAGNAVLSLCESIAGNTAHRTMIKEGSLP